MPTVQVDDLEMFYQVLREGDEIVLALHPSTVSGTMFGWATPKTDKFRTYLPDQRGHGKTNNPLGHLHLPRLVQDMLIFSEAMELPAMHGVGYSMGANVLLGMAMQHPQMFKSLVVIGANWHPPTQEQFSKLAGPLEERTGLALEVLHPERGMQNGWDHPLEALAAIDCPTVMLSGDRDPVSPPEDVVAMYRTLPNGRMLVIPHCGHFGYHNNALVRQFLTDWYTDL